MAMDSLVHVTFNSTATHFVAATATGIDVFSCRPFRHVFSKSGFACPDGGRTDACKVASADVTLSGALVAVVFREDTTVAGGDHPSDRIMYWSELQGEMMSQEMSPSCRGAAHAVRHSGSHVLVAGQDRVTLHEPSRDRTRRTDEFETGPNPLGVCALAQAGGGGGQAFVVACPLPTKGQVQVRRDKGRRVDVPAHNSRIACVALSRDGRLLATAGSKGTLLRIFSSSDGKKLQELRRGVDRADIHCLAFSPDSKWLAASSNKGTIHVFRVNADVIESSSPEHDGDDLDAPAESTSSPGAKVKPSLSYFTGLMPVPSYFHQDHSLAKFRLREGVKYMVAFGREPHIVLIIGMDGSFHRCQFDPVNGGDMEKLEYRNFMIGE